MAGKKETIFSNPEIFDPERWARDKPNPFGILNFGYGPRSCYGELMYSYTSYTIIILILHLSVRDVCDVRENGRSRKAIRHELKTISFSLSLDLNVTDVAAH